MDIWIWIGLALLTGLAVGGAFAAWYFRRQRADAKTISELQAELDDYRHEVTEHFVQTAELVNNMTRSYKAVYDHLEHGAYRLIGEETLRKELGYVDSEPVKLEYIGRRDRAAVLGPAGGTDSGTDSSTASSPEQNETAGSETVGGTSSFERKTTPGKGTPDSTAGSSQIDGRERNELQQHDSKQDDLKQDRLERESLDPEPEEDTGPVR